MVEFFEFNLGVEIFCYYPYQSELVDNYGKHLLFLDPEFRELYYNTEEKDRETLFRAIVKAYVVGKKVGQKN